MNAIRIVVTTAAATAMGACAAVPVTLPTRSVLPTKEVVLANLKCPWSIAFVSDDEAIISEKEGELLWVRLSTGERTAIGGFPTDRVTDIHGVRKGDNSGLFDVVLDPGFRQNRRIYVAYAAQKGSGRTTKVIGATVDETGGKYVLSDVQTLLEATPYTDNEFYHYGGGLVFGADGKLYVTVGERLFDEKDQPSLPIAQDVTDRRGKIYRLNPDGTIPDDNPDFGDEAVPGLFATGIRAAQGLTVEPKTKAIWFSEHGTRQGDEINRLKGGANYGWPIETTGRYRTLDYQPPAMPDADFEAPVWYWLQTVAPTGLTFYRGNAFPSWQGDLLVAGLSRGSLWRLNFEAGVVVSVEELFVSDRARTRKVAQSPDGTLYILTDAIFEVSPTGKLTFTGRPNGQLIRISNHP